jgi:hypothetical protein
MLLFAPKAEASQPPEVDPPSEYWHAVSRSFVPGKLFPLVAMGRPAFSIWVPDQDDIVLRTAAQDLAVYFKDRYGSAPPVLASPEDGQGNLIVLASPASVARLPHSVQPSVREIERLSKQGFAIQQIPWPGNRRALVCLGGSSLGARYATIEILRKMIWSRSSASVSIERLRDEPYFTRRALYINDGPHQMNPYNPNLIYDVNTYRWSFDEWKRFIDQLAFFRYNILQIWLTPVMFSPQAFEGGGAVRYFQETMRAVGQYAAPRGITLNLIAPINATVGAGTRLDQGIYKDLPLYCYLSPNKPEEKALMLRLWDYWTKAIPEVGVWTLFPGDVGGCMESGCGPETYVDLALEVSDIVKKNNPRAVLDFNVWFFFGWGPDFAFEDFNKDGRVDRGYKYLISKLKQFPPSTIFTLNINDFTSQPHVRGASFGGGSAAEYMREISAQGHAIQTWTYHNVAEGEGWIDHQYRIPQIIKQRDLEARFPISGGIYYTMTPRLNILTQFACAEAFWDPQVSEQAVMERYTDGVLGTTESKLIEIFPNFAIAPRTGYTFAAADAWHPDYNRILAQMRQSASVLESLKPPEHARFPILISPEEYEGELVGMSRLYERLSTLGLKVEEARGLVQRAPGFKNRPADSIRMNDAREALAQLTAEDEMKLRLLIQDIEAMDVGKMKTQLRAERYQIFLDHPTEFSALLPNLIDWFFNSFGADFVPSPGSGN